MNERTMQDMLYDMLTLDGHTAEEHRDDFCVTDIVVDTFAQAGVLTRNKGLVVKVKDEDGERHEFQITIVKSR